MKNLLIISHKSPYAPIDGGVLAIRNLYLDLKKSNEFKVEMFCLETEKHPHNSQLEREDDQIFTEYIDTRLKPIPAFFKLISNKSYNLSRFYSKSVSKRIQNILANKTYDYIVFESLFSTVYLKDIRSVFNGKCIYRSHNIEHHIWEKLRDSETFLPKRWYLQSLVNSLKKYEMEINAHFNGIFSISKTDLEFYRKHTTTPSELLYFSRNQVERKKPVNPKHFFHLASMDWQPNIDAVEWFVQNVWKQVHKKDSSLKLFLAGKSMPKEYFEMENIGITAFDYIEDGDKFMQSHGSLIVPLFSGSGIRIKVVDALCLQVPVISTQIGVLGLDLKHNNNFLLANTAEDFQNSIISIAQNEVNLEEIILNSTEYAHHNFDRVSVMTKFSQQLNSL